VPDRGLRLPLTLTLEDGSELAPGEIVVVSRYGRTHAMELVRLTPAWLVLTYVFHGRSALTRVPLHEYAGWCACPACQRGILMA